MEPSARAVLRRHLRREEGVSLNRGRWRGRSTSEETTESMDVVLPTIGMVKRVTGLVEATRLDGREPPGTSTKGGTSTCNGAETLGRMESQPLRMEEKNRPFSNQGKKDIAS